MTWWQIWLLISFLTYIVYSLHVMSDSNELHLGQVLLFLVPIPMILFCLVIKGMEKRVDQKLIRIQDIYFKEDFTNRETPGWWKETCRKVGGNSEIGIHSVFNMYRILKYKIPKEG